MKAHKFVWHFKIEKGHFGFSWDLFKVCKYCWLRKNQIEANHMECIEHKTNV